MEKIIISLINSIIGGAGEILNSLIMSLSENVFYVETAFTRVLGGSNIMSFDKIHSLIFDFAISLIILKFLKKGFGIYVGWYDGDKDENPTQLFIKFARALITLLCFRFFYDIVIDIVIDFIDKSLLALLALEETTDLTDSIVSIVGTSVFMGFSALALIIGYCVLWIQTITLGAEMFVLRIGFGFACVGLIDNDGGVYTPYTKKIVNICITVAVQLFLLRLSLILVGSGHLIWGLAFCMAAIKTPRSISEFMFAYGGGTNPVSGVVNTGYQAARVVKFITTRQF